MTRLLLLLFVSIIVSPCSSVQNRNPFGSGADDPVAILERDYQKLRTQIPDYGSGGQEVLTTAYQALREGKKNGRWQRIELPDLWAHAIKEGRGLFNDPDRRWGKTSAEETKDLIGQTTIGPWQMTVKNAKERYGPTYGVDSNWPDSRVYEYLRQNPSIQAKMIADLIADNYERNGYRSPYAIQEYFWLEAFLKKEIGQGPWDKSVLAEAPNGDWRQLTPEMKADTGMYGKQLVVGTRTNPHGLLYWLAICGKEDAIRQLLRTWRDQREMIWDEQLKRPRFTERPANFGIRPADLEYMRSSTEVYAMLNRLVTEVLAEKR